jgi:hypothetical protein
LWGGEENRGEERGIGWRRGDWGEERGIRRRRRGGARSRGGGDGKKERGGGVIEQNFKIL